MSSVAGNTDTSTTNFDKTVQVLIRKQLETLLRTTLPFTAPGSYIPSTLVKGSNGTQRFLNVPDLSVTTNGNTVTQGTAPWLDEGVAPTAQELTIGYEEFTAYQAGRTVKLTDVADMESLIELQIVAGDRVARQMAATIDLYVGNVVKAITALVFSGSSNTQTDHVAAGDILLGANLKRAVAILKGRNVDTFAGGSYRGIIHPYVTLDLQSDDDVGGWIDVNKYAKPDTILAGEIGRYAGITFMESTNDALIQADSGTASIDVYRTVIHGPSAWALSDYGALKTYFTPPGGHSDPLHQSAITGWKGFVGAMVIGAGANATNVSAVKLVAIESASSI